MKALNDYKVHMHAMRKGKERHVLFIVQAMLASTT